MAGREGSVPALLIVPGPGARELSTALSERLAGGLAIAIAPEPRGELEPSPARRIAAAMVALERIAAEVDPDAVLILGGGEEGLAAALVFAKLERPIAKLGAGREGDRDGALAERLCDLLLCADEQAADRLRRVGLGEKARVIGELEAPSEAAVQAIAAWLLHSAP